MSEGIDGIEETIRKILREKIFAGAEWNDPGVGLTASLDSVGRLTFLVELENHFEAELMGEGVSPEVFESVSSVARFVEARLSGDTDRKR